MTAVEEDMFKKRFRLDVRKFACSDNDWNSLSSQCVVFAVQ